MKRVKLNVGLDTTLRGHSLSLQSGKNTAKRFVISERCVGD